MAIQDNNSEFISAINAAFIGDHIIELTPSNDINLVKFEGGLDVVPKSIWKFSNNYSAIFKGVKIENTESFQYKLDGTLYNANGVEIEEQTPQMIIAGVNGRCNGAFAFIC